ncbi:twin-arginine translocase TatA/TatE family subunit [Thermoflexus sp.]|uniref:twin-arginine translocase TatA/TatE family subunit n=1 Tax=Thermoflexus sp. TaxID=1969742 RepID=UPI0025FEC827|nr:twin-arginine translocase TatA/TatE family subunit [Thermoflexus sp.]MDW8181510.1 twin-arginine translocase TatA/TatE family subunit [Anaerolineae bacterium]MCS6963727.1 twin-arginine translocase TatA/TatE family subunit [Thermoflexus sp.]MCS7352051.1 twin-arginine translocase TatA/TatE family subunit [Thermoflexus sp.]MCX7691679.1 twin-arginine translocase TatA/TatE family subunit [Thermoflexus sp.]MDW8185482.1 twin-arginine translocase TatA/TatE family subunit [Anaerolineae bacterium]
MIRIGAEELFLIFLLALLLFGPGRLTAIARELGQSVREFRRGLMGEPDLASRSHDRDSAGPPGPPTLPS